MMVLQTETTEESAAVGPVTKKRRYNTGWAEDRPWLRYDCEQKVMYCVWCRNYDRNTERNEFVKGCSSMKVERIKKHDASRQHKDSEFANHASKKPNEAPLERGFMVIAVQTATLERGFSLMKRIKSDWRSLLQPKTLTQLMSIKLNGPTLQDFNPLHATAQWWKTGPR